MDRFQNLRQQAYNILSKEAAINTVAKKNMDTIIEELFVHQIELELQNINLSEIHTQLEKTHQVYFDLYQNAPIGYFTLNANGLIKEVNLAGSELLNINKRRLINRSFVRFIDPVSQIDFSKFFRRVINEKTRQSCEIKMVRQGNPSFSAKIETKTHNAFLSNDKEFLIVASDISNYLAEIENVKLRKEKERAEENNRAKDIFLATLSHELRTPMTAICCWLQVLKKQLNKSEVLDKAIKSMEESTSIQNCLINDLLDLSSIVLGKNVITLQTINLIEIIKLTIETMKVIAAEKNISIELKTSIDKINLCLDAYRLRQIFYNLINNSIKYTGEGGKIEIMVNLHTCGVHVEIKDNGQGISAEFLPHIFEPFTKLNSTDGSQKSLGLGLPLVRALLELQGGTISAQSPGLGKGTSFIICFKNRMPVIQ